MIYTEKKTFPGTGDTLIYFILENSFEKDSLLKKLNETLSNKITDVVSLYDFKGKRDEHILLEGGSMYKHIVLYGLGKSKEVSSLILMRAIAKVHSLAQSLHSKNISLFYGSVWGKDLFSLGKHISLGWELSQYSFDKYKSQKSRPEGDRPLVEKLKDLNIFFQNDIPPSFKEGITLGKHIADGITLTRNLVNEPASHMHPDTLVSQAIAIAQESRPKVDRPLGEKGTVTVQVLERSDCEKLGMGSYLGVAQGSDREPKFIVMKYVPDRLKMEDGRLKKICLVGKSITFDSGGLSLKPSKGMETMKMDMAGGGTVLGVFDILSKINTVKYEVWGVLPACENMPSGKALKPGDVVKALNNKTIEVLNTDAEGRLALADGVAYAEKYIKPDLMIDLATLTGACMVALGTDIAGVFGNDTSFVKKFLGVAKKEGEEAWELPLFKQYAASLKSDIADIKNIGGTGYGGAISGALFIGEFVKKTKWLHIDIAGPAYNMGSQKGIMSKGGTGWGVSTIISLLTS